MANTGISIDDDLLEDFDDIIWAKKAGKELDRDTSRSEVIEELIEQYVEENREYLDEGNGQMAVAIAN